jgi:hypothetical protein
MKDLTKLKKKRVIKSNLKCYAVSLKDDEVHHKLRDSVERNKHVRKKKMARCGGLSL